MLRAEKLSLARSARDLFVELDWMLDRGDRVGLVGPNGAGKSSLLRVLAGELTADSGAVILPKGERVGYLPQEGIVHEGRALLAEALSGMKTLGGLAEEIKASLAEIDATGHDDPRHARALERHAVAEASFRALGGYSMESQATRVLRGLGFKDSDLTRDAGEMSGGWQMRIALAKHLLEAPDVLLLDEPTNHLDIEARTWLEHFLSAYSGAVVLVSHDRVFLDRVVRRIAELSQGKLTTYNSNFSAYLLARDERLQLLRKKYAEQQEEIKRQELFIRRFRAKNTKATLVQSRIKALDKMERIELPPSEERLRFRFAPAPRSGPAPLSVAGGNKRYGKLVVLDDVNLTIARGERVCLAGPNGAGKSTLLRILAGREGLDAGQLVTDRSARIAYFAQDQAKELIANETVMGAVEKASPGALPAQIRSLLGAFLFRGDDVHKPCGVLSGGERNRVALARVLLQEANVLLLDEPTNHLDLQAKESLRDALLAYDGAVIFVSHDRDFTAEIASSVVEVGGGAVRRYELGFEEFLWRRALDLGHPGPALAGVPAPDLWFLRGTEFFEEEQHVAAGSAPAGTPAQPVARKLTHEERRKLQRRVETLEKRVNDNEARSSALSAELAALDLLLGDPAVAQDHARLWTHVKERERLVEENERVSADWEAAMTELEAARAELT